MKKKANRLDAIKMIISSKDISSQEELLQAPRTLPSSAPGPAMPAAWLMTSTTANVPPYWAPLPATTRS